MQAVSKAEREREAKTRREAPRGLAKMPAKVGFQTPRGAIVDPDARATRPARVNSNATTRQSSASSAVASLAPVTESKAASSTDPLLDRAPRAKSSSELLAQFGETKTYNRFKLLLEQIDQKNVEPEEKQYEKTQLLLEFYRHLQALPLLELLTFGEELAVEISNFDESDSLETAFGENRVIYKAWHKLGHISVAAKLPPEAKEGDGRELVGADTLNVFINPVKFRHHKDKTKEPGSTDIPLGIVPASLLNAEHQKNTVFRSEQGTVTALLPENMYAAFTAYNETAKLLLRRKPPEGLAGEELSLYEHARHMRASVTRPVFFENDDLQSETAAFVHENKPGRVYVRKIHTHHEDDHNLLNESLDQKLTNDPYRSNAIFYQTYYEHSPNSRGEWNEMVVKYRSTGHTLGVDEQFDKWVPGLHRDLEIRELIKGRIADKSTFNETKAEQGINYTKAFVGGNDDSAVESKKSKGKRSGKKGGKGR